MEDIKHSNFISLKKHYKKLALIIFALYICFPLTTVNLLSYTCFPLNLIRLILLPERSINNPFKKIIEIKNFKLFSGKKLNRIAN